MINSGLMDKLESLGFGADVDALESYVASLQDAAGDGEPIVTDTQYDMYFNLLKQLKPTSEVLLRNWETSDFDLDDTDDLLKKQGMLSITTIQNLDELYKFKDALGNKQVNLFASCKLNGHAIRAVYKNGLLVSGSTRGRYKKGRDITKHLKAVLPNYIDKWKDISLLEVRGEMLVSLENFNNYLKDRLKTPLSAVTSLIRDSVTDIELTYLDCLCYKIITNDRYFETLEEQFIELEEVGFKIPLHKRYDDIDYYNLDSTVETILEDFSLLADNDVIGYATDGIVVAVDSCDDFEDMGLDGNSSLGNFALKMGRHWECNHYSGIINRIEFVPGKKYFTPKAIIDPVVTVTGAEVTTVPLYNVGVMNDLKLIPGAEIHFRFGGETGVTLCTADGTKISEL